MSRALVIFTCDGYIAPVSGQGTEGMCISSEGCVEGQLSLDLV